MLTSRKVSALALLLCCADAATINVHAVSFSQPLCCANFYKDIYSSNMSVETKYCKIGHFNFMFWSLKIKYTSMYTSATPMFLSKKTIFVSHFKPKESREFRVF